MAIFVDPVLEIESLQRSHKICPWTHLELNIRRQTQLSLADIAQRLNRFLRRKFKRSKARGRWCNPTGLLNRFKRLLPQPNAKGR